MAAAREDAALPPFVVREDTPEWLTRQAAELQRYSMKRRVQLIDFLKTGTTVDLDDGVQLSLHSEYELRRVRKSGPSDQAVLEWVRGFKPGDVFYDVGANTGLFSLLAGKLHAGAITVFAFEPSYSSYEALVRNVVVNGLTSSVHAMPVALYGQTGLKPFHYRKLDAGAAKHGIDVPFDSKTRQLFEPVLSQLTVTMTIDDFVRQLGAPSPTHLKIDVDGHESQVLAGAAGVLAASVQTVCIEATQADESDDRKEVLLNQLVTRGFRLSETVHHHEDRYPRVFDYLFVRG